MKKGGIKRIAMYVLSMIVLALVIMNLLQNPLKGNIYDLIGIPREEVTAVRVFHYGQTLVVQDENTVAQLVELFDCELSRGGSDYIGHSCGCDWSITFLNSEKEKSDTFGFIPHHQSNESIAKVKIGHYDYFCDKDIIDDLINALWRSEFDPESLKEDDVVLSQ